MPRARPPVIVVGVLLAVLAGAQAWAVVDRHGQPEQAGVPWVNRPAPPEPPPRFAPPSTAPPCAAGVLRGSIGEGNGVTGQYLEPIQLTNVGPVPCSLPGRPTLFGVRTGAPRQAIGLGDGRGSAVDGRGGAPFRQTDLLPGGRATITLDIPYTVFLDPGQACARDNPHRPAPFDSLVVGLATGVPRHPVITPIRLVA